MMRRRQRNAFPLVALLAFEVLAIVGLQALGSNVKMQVPWGELGVWLQNGSVDEIAAPIIRLFALGVAYWMFGSTALFALAQASRIPAAIRATSAFTLPSVRRVVDGAVAVSIATTSFVGLSATAASAATTETAVTVSVSDDLTVPTPALGQSVANAATQTPAQERAGGQDSAPTPGTGAPETPAAPEGSGEATPTPGTGAPQTPADDAGEEATPTPTPSPSTPDAAPGESETPEESTTTQPPTTEAPTTQAPTTEAPSTQAPAAPTAGNQWVPTPRPAGPAQAPTTTTTAAPQPAAPAAPTQAPEVLGAQEHRVVPGDNLWTISRDALASASNKPASELTEAQIRDYWLKVIEANRDNLRSGDPHWIFPGEVISLPAAS